MKIKLFHLGIVALFSLALGLFLGSQIGVSIADTFPQFIKIETEITAYSPSPNQTDNTPFLTASNLKVTPQDLNELLYVAVSRDLLAKFTPGAPLEYGDKIYSEFIQVEKD